MDTIPAVIERYQRAADEQDWDALVACFTEDARVVDEGQTYLGLEAIRRWREEAASKYVFTSTTLKTTKIADDRYEVTSLLRGNFPGGEATLTSVFSLTGALIRDLAMT